ncbi:hypothetical protein N7478_000546 [Penicillium angulare]|uniref:uncharacterized protein n=1 Tax=Penicillium angulare TaxID=116970 RepID=UPI00253FC186|nr:uncharacterized protein N7478_000546 [Penicillium angulare]KAJ5291295.1 hypothetical protein N7478_000546 [Penicillium angulare]
MTKSMLSVALLASYLSIASAATCYAVGYIDTNSAMVVGPLTNSNGVYVYDADDNKIGTGSTEKGACTDLDEIELDGFDDTFGWAASCNANSIK